MEFWTNLTYNQKILTASFITTFFLVVTTILYTLFTNKMANVMKKDFEISNRPYITVRTLDKRAKDNNLIYSVSLINSGKTPGIITKTKVEGINNDSSSKTLSDINNLTILNPGEFIKQDIATIMTNGLNTEYKIKLTITYKSPSQPKAQYKTTYLYRYKGDPESPLTIINSEME